MRPTLYQSTVNSQRPTEIVLTVDIERSRGHTSDLSHCQPSTVISTSATRKDQLHERRRSHHAGAGARHQGRQEGRDRLRRRGRDRDLRLHRVRHRRRAVLRPRVLPGRQPARRHPGVVRHPRCRVRRPPAGRHHRRAPRRQARPQAGAGGLADRDGSGHLRHRPAAHLRRRRHPGPDPAGDGAHHPGPRVRRRVGRGDPDELRARPVAGEGPLHRHRAGRLPGRSAAGQPGVLGQRAPAR